MRLLLQGFRSTNNRLPANRPVRQHPLFLPDLPDIPGGATIHRPSKGPYVFELPRLL